MIQTLNFTVIQTLNIPVIQALNLPEIQILNLNDPNLKYPSDLNPKFSRNSNPTSPSDPNPKSRCSPNQLCRIFLPWDPNPSQRSRWSQNRSESLSCHRVQLWWQRKELTLNSAGKVRKLGRGSREKWEKGGNLARRGLAAQMGRKSTNSKGQAGAAAAENGSQILQKLPDPLKIRYSK